MKLGDVLRTKDEFSHSKKDDGAVLLWVCFIIAFLILGSMGVMYWVMRCRKNKLLKAKALAEGKISLKEIDEDDGDPDKEIEMHNM